MANLNDQLGGDFDAMLASFGEAATFTPRDGTARSITIIVDRGKREPMRGNFGAFVRALIVYAKNHATEGITPDELNGRLAFKEHYGAASNTTYVLRPGCLLESDAGVLKLDPTGNS